jgi:2-C-methyl-D-erythritol 4-phosphate cytidylyltransferase
MEQRKGVAILLMGGMGTRMGDFCQDKTLVLVAGKPLFLYSLIEIEKSKNFFEIVIVIRDSAQQKEIEGHLCALNMRASVSYVRGGNSRQKSVLNALLYVQQKHPNFVLIHDAVRPFVTQNNLRQLLSALEDHSGAILAHRATDTLIDVSNGERRYLQRDAVWNVETPQMFNYEVILDAYLKAKGPLTDDSSALQRDAKIKIIENFHFNTKVTYPRDLTLVEALLTKELER